ncbi:unnamed protein product [Gadus morhua 'NCC']
MVYTGKRQTNRTVGIVVCPRRIQKLFEENPVGLLFQDSFVWWRRPLHAGSQEKEHARTYPHHHHHHHLRYTHLRYTHLHYTHLRYTHLRYTHLRYTQRLHRAHTTPASGCSAVPVCCLGMQSS